MGRLCMFGFACLVLVVLVSAKSLVSRDDVDAELAALERALDMLETAETANSPDNRGYDDDEPPCDIDDEECWQMIQARLTAGGADDDDDDDRKRSQEERSRGKTRTMYNGPHHPIHPPPSGNSKPTIIIKPSKYPLDNRWDNRFGPRSTGNV